MSDNISFKVRILLYCSSPFLSANFFENWEINERLPGKPSQGYLVYFDVFYTKFGNHVRDKAIASAEPNISKMSNNKPWFVLQLENCHV